jgi:hypothetical protein
MGGVNFTRNRAWWHTVMWDEYGQRHQYLATFPTVLVLMPLYWYGASANRNIEQNFAAKMYQLDYENRRNRLTHNMIMEHFEMHVEKAQQILDEVKEHGFEKAFEHQINNPPEVLDTLHPLGKINNEMLGEEHEQSGFTGDIDTMMEHFDLPYWLRLELDKFVKRRETPHAPYKYLPSANTDFHRTHEMHHVYIDPFEQVPKPKAA